MIFKNRQEAGERLAIELKKHNIKNPYVIALPRGGVPVGYQVAKELNAPLDVIIVRKLGLPYHPEIGFGAIAPEGVTLLNTKVLNQINIKEELIEKVVEKEENELMRRLNKYSHNHKIPDLSGKTAILIDDGMATGTTAQVGVEYLRLFNPEDIIVATPVCSPDSLDSLEQAADKMICLYTPIYFSGVAQWYRDFHQLTDDEVLRLLNEKSNKY